MLICSFRTKNFQCEQSTFKINKFRKRILQVRTSSILRNFAHEISLMGRYDWSVGQCLQTSNEASTASSIGVGFRKFISSVKSAHFRKKNFEIFLSKLISKLISNVKGALNAHIAHQYHGMTKYCINVDLAVC